MKVWFCSALKGRHPRPALETFNPKPCEQVTGSDQKQVKDSTYQTEAHKPRCKTSTSSRPSGTSLWIQTPVNEHTQCVTNTFQSKAAQVYWRIALSSEKFRQDQISVLRKELNVTSCVIRGRTRSAGATHGWSAAKWHNASLAVVRLRTDPATSAETPPLFAEAMMEAMRMRMHPTE